MIKVCSWTSWTGMYAKMATIVSAYGLTFMIISLKPTHPAVCRNGIWNTNTTAMTVPVTH